MPTDKIIPTTCVEAWNTALKYLDTQTLRWGTPRHRAAHADACVTLLRREMHWYWALGDVPSMTRVARGYCRAFLAAGKEWSL